MSFIYLASPYNSPQTKTRRDRYYAAQDAVYWLLSRKIWVYSPIVHCHFLAADYELPMGADFWLPYNNAILKRACALWVLNADPPAVEASAGVQAEIQNAREFGLPVNYMRFADPAGYCLPPVPKEILECNSPSTK